MDPFENEAVFTLLSRLIDLDALNRKRHLLYRTPSGHCELHVRLIAVKAKLFTISLVWKDVISTGACMENAICVTLDVQRKTISATSNYTTTFDDAPLHGGVCDTNLGVWLAITALKRYRLVNE